MKIFSIVILLLHAQYSYTCNKPITLQVGPFLTSTFIEQYWMDFALDIKKQMGCPVKVQPSSSYTQYLNTLISGQGDVFLVPNHYVKALLKKGLTPIIKSTDGAQVYIISKYNINKNGPNILIGGTILVPSRYTRAYLELEDWLNQNQLKNKVRLNLNHSHDTTMLLMLKGDYSAAVVLDAIYKKLPNIIKAKYPATKLKNKSGASMLIKSKGDGVLAGAVVKARTKLNFLTWEKVTTPQPKEPFSYRFSVQLDQFIANKILD